jgi:hypothetical protein
VEHLKRTSLEQAPSLLASFRLGRKGLPGTNTTLFQTFVNNGHKEFYNIVTWTQTLMRANIASVIKMLWIRSGIS